MLRLTNCIGDVPYSEAADDIDQPKYDTQKDIYYTIFDELKDAVSKLDESSANNVGSYDLIYGGDAAKWKKFANSIRLRMAVRISDVDAAKAKTEAEAAFGELYPHPAGKRQFQNAGFPGIKSFVQRRNLRTDVFAVNIGAQLEIISLQFVFLFLRFIVRYNLVGCHFGAAAEVMVF